MNYGYNHNYIYSNILCQAHRQLVRASQWDNSPVHIAAAPQLILFYMFVCILRALMRPQNAHKHVLQLEAAAGGPPV
jgi:hypothetical protein